MCIYGAGGDGGRAEGRNGAEQWSRVADTASLLPRGLDLSLQHRPGVGPRTYILSLVASEVWLLQNIVLVWARAHAF